MKKYSVKFWIGFWVVSALLLSAWYIFLQLRGGELSKLKSSLDLVPMPEQTKSDLEATLSIGDFVLAHNDKPKTFLLLFQNNWELRPGGGFIGSFGILKMRNGQVETLQIHDTGNFDGRIPDTVTPPYPMQEYLHIDSWKLRDANYSPDFPTNARKVEEFYRMGNGEERFDGVIGITTNVLTSLLRITGPVTLEGYPGTYDSEGAILTLEEQVEKKYHEQNIEKGDRKEVMRSLADAILKKLQPLTIAQKIRLANLGLEELRNKNIQLFFHDEGMQRVVEDRGWAGTVDARWSNDFLLLVDANLGAYKSDSLMKREVRYRIDFSKEKPEAVLDVVYTHTGTERTWLINHYTSYLRVYVPTGSWLESVDGGKGETQYANEFGKRVFGTVVYVPVGTSKTVTFRYTLPQTIDAKTWNLKLQKQSGIGAPQYSVKTVNPDGMETAQTFSLDQERIVSPNAL